MKSLYQTLLYVAIGAVCVTSAQAQVAKDNFNGYGNGILTEISDWRDGTDGTVSDSFTVAGGEMAIVRTNRALTQWVVYDIPVQTGLFTMTWTMRYEGAADSYADVGVCLSDSANYNLNGNNAPDYNEQGFMVRMYNEGVFDARNGDLAGGGTYARLADVDYRDGTTFALRVVVSILDSSYSVYVRPVGGDEVMIAEEFLFRRIESAETGGSNAIAIWNNDSTADTMVYIDNLLLRAGEQTDVPVDENPANIDSWELMD
ncbi:MAG: hypothetical protein GC154_03345 [bacterium]|nr:hypothetical protein [bacterium]